jgi:hypothetical protein
MAKSSIPEGWFTEKLTIEEAETKHMVQLNLDSKTVSVPFGYQNKEWAHFKLLVKPGDEIWEYDSPGDYWSSLCGRAGIALVRGDEIIFDIVTMMN